MIDGVTGVPTRLRSVLIVITYIFPVVASSMSGRVGFKELRIEISRRCVQLLSLARENVEVFSD